VSCDPCVLSKRKCKRSGARAEAEEVQETQVRAGPQRREDSRSARPRTTLKARPHPRNSAPRSKGKSTEKAPPSQRASSRAKEEPGTGSRGVVGTPHSRPLESSRHGLPEIDQGWKKFGDSDVSTMFWKTHLQYGEAELVEGRENRAELEAEWEALSRNIAQYCWIMKEVEREEERKQVNAEASSSALPPRKKARIGEVATSAPMTKNKGKQRDQTPFLEQAEETRDDSEEDFPEFL
jgi:hypothetical protein